MPVLRSIVDNFANFEQFARERIPSFSEGFCCTGSSSSSFHLPFSLPFEPCCISSANLNRKNASTSTSFFNIDDKAENTQPALRTIRLKRRKLKSGSITSFAKKKIEDVGGEEGSTGTSTNASTGDSISAESANKDKKGKRRIYLGKKSSEAFKKASKVENKSADAKDPPESENTAVEAPPDGKQKLTESEEATIKADEEAKAVAAKEAKKKETKKESREQLGPPRSVQKVKQSAPTNEASDDQSGDGTSRASKPEPKALPYEDEETKNKGFFADCGSNDVQLKCECDPNTAKQALFGRCGKTKQTLRNGETVTGQSRWVACDAKASKIGRPNEKDDRGNPIEPNFTCSLKKPETSKTLTYGAEAADGNRIVDLCFKGGCAPQPEKLSQKQQQDVKQIGAK